ncbi:hypothetical protein JCM19238_3868 [Vibrio ponticus]|nr:hypothetical protein JCM19238_3868 [Vibrio ponticus]
MQNLTRFVIAQNCINQHDDARFSEILMKGIYHQCDMMQKIFSTP